MRTGTKEKTSRAGQLISNISHRDTGRSSQYGKSQIEVVLLFLFFRPGISKCFQTSISIHLHVSLALRLLLCRAPSENEKQSIEEQHYRAFVSDASQNVIWSKQTTTHLPSSSPAIDKVSFIHHNPLLVMHHSLQEMTKINKPKWQFIVCCHTNVTPITLTSIG